MPRSPVGPGSKPATHQQACASALSARTNHETTAPNSEVAGDHVQLHSRRESAYARPKSFASLRICGRRSVTPPACGRRVVTNDIDFGRNRVVSDHLRMRRAIRRGLSVTGAGLPARHAPESSTSGAKYLLASKLTGRQRKMTCIG